MGSSPVTVTYTQQIGEVPWTKIDENLTWKPRNDRISAKLNNANAIFSKIRHYVNQKTLKAIYHAIFESHLYSSFWFGHIILNLHKDCLSYKKKH